MDLPPLSSASGADADKERSDPRVFGFRPPRLPGSSGTLDSYFSCSFIFFKRAPAAPRTRRISSSAYFLNAGTR